MRSSHLPVLVIAFLMLVAAPASAAGWSAPSTVTAKGIGYGGVASAPGGSLTVVSQTYTSSLAPADVIVRTLRGTIVASRLSLRRGRLVDWVAAPAGGADVLVRLPAPGAQRRPQLVLARVNATGNWRLSTVSRSVAAGAPGAIARRGDGSLAIIWADAPEGRTGRAGDAFVSMRTAAPPGTGTRPRVRLTRARTVRGLPPPTPARSDFSTGITDVVLGFGKAGAPVVALTTVSERSTALVLASLSGSGRVRELQVANTFTGYVSLTVAPSGRVGVILEDRGSTVGDQECISEGRQRIIRVAIREAGARSFSPMQLLDRRPFECLAPGARMVARPDGHMAVLWGAESVSPPRDLVRLAEAAPGARFGEPSTPWTGELLGDALFSPGGDLLVSTIRPAGTTRTGQLIVRRRAASATFGPEEQVAASGVSQAQLVNGSDGVALLAWRQAADALAISRSAQR